MVNQSKRALRVCELHNTRLFVQVISRWGDGLVMDADILSWSVPLAPWRSPACRHGHLLQDGLIGFVLDVGNPSVVNHLPAILSWDDLICRHVEGSSFLASGFFFFFFLRALYYEVYLVCTQ